MLKKTALAKLLEGTKVRAKEWDKNKYITMATGAILDNNDKPYNLLTAKEKVWEIYVEPVKASNTADTTKLEEMVKTLTEQVQNLTDTVNENTHRTVDTEIDTADISNDVLHGIGDEVQKAIKDNLPQEERTQEETVKIFYGVTALKAIRDQFKTELLACNDKREVLSSITKFIPFCWMGGRKIKTVARYYSDMRNVIKEVGGDFQDLALDLFAVPADVYERIKSIDTNKVLEKMEEKETFDLDHIRYVVSKLKTDIETSISLGDDATIEDFQNNGIEVTKQTTVEQTRGYLYATYLAFATGRRLNEILKTLTLIKKKNVWYYSGIAKKQTDGIEIKAIALDDDFNFLNTVLKTLRKDIDTSKLTNTETNNKYNRIFNRAFKRLTNTTYTFHDAREIYAEIAYLDFGKKKGTEREEIDFKSDILGHQVDKERLVSTEHYMTKKAKDETK